MAKTPPPIHCKYDRLEDPRAVQLHPDNDNVHPGSQIKALAEIIQRTGWRHPAILSSLSGKCVAGEGRILAARRLKCQVPVVVQPFDTPSEELAFLLSDNKLAELSQRDEIKTGHILAQIDSHHRHLTGYLDKEIEKLLTQIESEIPALAPISPPISSPSSVPNQYGIIIICADEAEQEKIFQTATATFPDLQIKVVCA